MPMPFAIADEAERLLLVAESVALNVERSASFRKPSDRSASASWPRSKA